MADEQQKEQQQAEQPKEEQPAQGEQQQEGQQQEAAAAADEQQQEGDQQQEGGDGGDGEGEDAEQPASKKPRRTDPVRMGYRTFHSVEELVHYFKNLLTAAPRDEDLNEYEYLALLDLLKQHPEWDRKAGAGIKAFQVRDINVPDGKAKAFFAVHKDGSLEDFSYIKCASQVYPGEVNVHPNTSKRARGEGLGGRGRGRGGRSGQQGRGGRQQRGRGGRGGQRGGRGRR